MSEESSKYKPIRQIQIADRRYELLCLPCSVCGKDYYEIFRWTSCNLSRYRMPDDFDPNDFETFVDNIDGLLLETAPELFEKFWECLDSINSPNGIDADFSFAFRLIEYGRQKTSALKKLGYLDAITMPSQPTKPDQSAVRLAFELGYAVSQHQIMANFENYFDDGYAMSEWRESGLPKAREERLRQGARTRAAIAKAAERLYTEDHSLIRNDLETARRILKLDIPELQKGNGLQIGIDAITRHLRAIRQAHNH